VVYVVCDQAECIFNSDYNRCTSTCPDLTVENADVMPEEYQCDSYMSSDMAMDGEDW